MIVEWLEEVSSTMDVARLRAERGAADGSVLAATCQTAGRGRSGRLWHSPAGNLYATIILRPTIPPSRAAELGFVTAMAIAEAVDAMAGPPTTLKWPNDVMRGGAKLCGILLERLGDGAILVGIGLNVRHVPPDLSYPVTSLAAAGADVTPRDALAAILPRLDAGLAAWQAAGFAPVLASWRQRGPPAGAPLQVRLADRTITGGFAGLGPDGCLLLDTPSGRQRLLAGDVLF